MLYLKATKDIVPLHQGHSFPSDLLPLSPILDSNPLAVFYGYIRKLISPTSLSASLSASLPLLYRQYFIADMSPSPTLSPFQSFPFSSVFYSCCNSHLTFLLGDYFIMRAQLPPSLPSACPTPLIALHLSILFIKITFRTFFNLTYLERALKKVTCMTVQSGIEEEEQDNKSLMYYTYMFFKSSFVS